MLEPMSDPPVWGEDGRSAERQDGPAELLVQILLKFTVFMGFLLTAAMARLQDATALAEERGGAIEGFLGTPEGELCVELAESQEDAQRAQLMLAWERIHPRQAVARGLAEAADGERINLPASLGYLPERRYTKLMESAQGVFPLASAGGVERKVVAGLLIEVWKEAGLALHDGWKSRVAFAVRRAFSSRPALAGHERNVDRLAFDKDKPSLANLCSTASRIRESLQADRQMLAKLQAKLVTRIMLVRPFEGVAGVTTEEVVVAIVADLKPHLMLLAEVEQGLTSR